MEKKKKIIIAIIGVLVILIVAIIVIGITKNDSPKDKEKYYVSEFTKISEDLYSEYYYPVLLKSSSEDEVKEYVKKHNTIGFKFTLETIKGYAINEEKKEYLDIINDFLAKNKNCNENKTMAVIYPKEPYSKTDFTSEIILNCVIK